MISGSTGRLRRRLTTPAVLLAVTATIATASVAFSSASDAATPHNPYGAFDRAAISGYDRVEVVGWAEDNDYSRPLTVRLTLDGHLVLATTANKTRPDVAKRYPKQGPSHGFDTTLTVREGRHRICATALNRGAGKSTSLGCKNVVIANNPTGSFDSLKQVSGGLVVTGGAVDPNTSAPVTVTISVDGVAKTPVVANSALHRGHGFQQSYPLPQGAHRVCVTAGNLGWGSNTTFPCRTISLRYDPLGAVTSLVQKPGGFFSVTGWAVDDDSPGTALTIDVREQTGTNTFTTLSPSPTAVPGAAAVRPGHTVTGTYPAASGSHTICLYAHNVDGTPGRALNVGCQTITLNFNPVTAITALTQLPGAIRVTGTAADPDTTAGVQVHLKLDGTDPASVTSGTAQNRHTFTVTLPETAAGAHLITATADNAANTPATTTPAPNTARSTIVLNYDPVGSFERIARRGDKKSVLVSGWTYDRGTIASIQVIPTVDGVALPAVSAALSRADLAKTHPGFGTAHGFSITLPTNDLEHKVCLTAVNVGSGNNVSLGCKLIIAVHPKIPSPPGKVTAVGGFGAAEVSWTPPANDGGAPWTRYNIVSSPGGLKAAAGPGATSAVIGGLKPKTRYRFAVTAVNVAGSSRAGVSNVVITQTAPPPQRTPAPVSTSRYVRNIHNNNATDVATLKREGVADAKANPSGHGYLILLQIGGQDHYDGGVVLSAGVRFVTYATVVANMKAYVDGYASAQRASAPVTIAIGTNNDMDVNATTGKEWADKVVDPVVAYAKKYGGIKIAGANDIEPGFRASYAQSKAWLQGYLGATSAAFVFNGSADGCSWTATGRGCNNGWSMAGLYTLAAGMAPGRTVNLPQIYNYTMPKQWKYISLTGVTAGKPRINFGGPLTEWTACDQAGGCGSISGHAAWSQLWTQLQSDSRLKVSSVPYSTDLRIDH